MSLNYGYWPRGAVPAKGTCGPMLRYAPDGADSSFIARLAAGSKGGAVAAAGAAEPPGEFRSLGSVSYCADRVLGYDAFARAALETLRSSYTPMPSGSAYEFGAFFSGPNYERLCADVARLSGYPTDRQRVMDAMISAFTMTAPRSDPTDLERRTVFSPEVTASYVAEMNRLVLDNTVEENRQAHRLWDYYVKNRDGPSDFPEHLDTDTRTRFTVSLYPMDYMLPDD